MASDNPAFTPDTDSSSGVYIISNHAEGLPTNPPETQSSSKKKTKEEMGWYRQLRRQMGVSDSVPLKILTYILFAAPGVLIPRFLVSFAAPPALYLPAVAWFVGRLSILAGLHPTTAMLVIGLIFRATGLFEVPPGPWRRFVYQTRYVAVAVVLVKGGLAVCHLPNLALIFIPCTIEATFIALMARYLLDFPWTWGYIFGFAMSAASSSVSIGKLTQLKKDGYGAKELYGLLLPTSTIENIFSITTFTTTLTMALVGEDDWWVYVIKGPVAICCGLAFAVSWAFLMSLFPHRQDTHVVGKRSILVLLGALVVYVGAKELGMPPGGPLGTVATGVSVSFVLAAQGWGEGKNPVLPIVSEVWDVLEGALFAFVGAEVDIYAASLHELCMAIAIMVVTMIVRLVVFTIIMALRRQFTRGEILVGILVWFPKATVLAALAPQVLDNIRRTRGDPLVEDSDEFRMGRMILLGSVVEMLITTPIGYLLLRFLGEKLLQKEKASDKEASAGLNVASKL